MNEQPIFYMNCRKCKREFNEKDLQLSHDVPRYMGGVDLDGRHWVCIECHKKYEHYVFTRVANYISKLSDELKSQIKEITKDCSMRFFK